MNEEIKSYAELMKEFDREIDYGGIRPSRPFGRYLLEQIRLRDVRIAELSPEKRKLSAALAFSALSLAKTQNTRGKTIVVQLQHPSFAEWNLHVWIVNADGRTSETDFSFRCGYKLKDIYEVDPSAKIWEVV